MRISIVYYSRTGNTERVVNTLKLKLVDRGFVVDVYRVLPVREYSKPLHVNPRLIYDTLIRKGTSIRFKPNEPRLDSYDIVILASPIWIGTLASPIQEFLRRYATMRSVVVITTSIQSIRIVRIEEVVRELGRVKPLLCVNIRANIIKDYIKLTEAVQGVVERLTAILRMG